MKTQQSTSSQQTRREQLEQWRLNKQNLKQQRVVTQRINKENQKSSSSRLVTPTTTKANVYSNKKQSNLFHRNLKKIQTTPPPKKSPIREQQQQIPCPTITNIMSLSHISFIQDDDSASELDLSIPSPLSITKVQQQNKLASGIRELPLIPLSEIDINTVTPISANEQDCMDIHNSNCWDSLILSPVRKVESDIFIPEEIIEPSLPQKQLQSVANNSIQSIPIPSLPTYQSVIPTEPVVIQQPVVVEQRQEQTLLSRLKQVEDELRKTEIERDIWRRKYFEVLQQRIKDCK
jgi:hypothetical protein